MNKAIVDSDTLVYTTAVISEDVSDEIAKSRLDYNVSKLLDEAGCSEYTLYVSGKDNFRYSIDATYKGNRADKPSPSKRQLLHNHLVEHWGAVECQGYEADDACGIHQTEETVVVGIDKDLLQIPGKHYRWAIVRKGIVIREASWEDVSQTDGLRSFFKQLLVGDVSDNVVGVKGIGAKKAEALITPLETEEEMYNVVKTLYGESEAEQERFQRNCDLLWLWRSLGITYNIRREINA